jgi:hypothetical protein
MWKERRGFGEKARRRDNLEHKDGRMASEWILGRSAGNCRVDPAGSG